MLKFLSFALLVATVIKVSDGSLPSTIKVCARNNPNVANCIIESIKDLQPRLATGEIAPNFRIPGLEPLQLDNIHMDRGPNFQVFLTNMVVNRGASNFVIEKLKVNLNVPTFDFIINLPRLDFSGKYDLKMRIVLIDLAGKGDIYGTLENFRAKVRLRAKTYDKNGKKYIHFDKIQMKLAVGKTRIDLRNLFDNNPTLGQIGNGFVNENSAYFVSDIVPSLEKNLSEIFTKAANDIVANASFDEMFPAT